MLHTVCKVERFVLTIIKRRLLLLLSYGFPWRLGSLSSDSGSIFVILRVNQWYRSVAQYANKHSAIELMKTGRVRGPGLREWELSII